MSLTSSLRISRQLSLPRQHGLPSAAVPHRRPVSSRSPASRRNLSNANLIRDHEVGGSNPLATTILFEGLSRTPGLPPHHCRRNCGVQHEWIQREVRAFDPHRPYQPSHFLPRTCETREAAKGSSMEWVVSAFGFEGSRHGWQADHDH